MTDQEPRNGGVEVAFRLVLLGDLGLYKSQNGTEQRVFGPGKPTALMAYLALSPARTATRDHLADLLWSDRDLADARHALRQTIWYRRKQADVPLVVGDGAAVVLESRVACDAADLASLDSRESRLIVESYTGSFVPDVSIPGGGEFERWADGERERFKRLYCRAAELEIEKDLSSGNSARAVRLARAVVSANPLHQASHRNLIRALADSGDVVGQWVAIDELHAMLEREGIGAERATTELLHSFSEDRKDRSHRDGWQESSFEGELVGRETEFSRIIDAFKGSAISSKAISILGAPGMGKSRLLREVSLRIAELGGQVVTAKGNLTASTLPLLLVCELIKELVELPGAAGVRPSIASLLVGACPQASARFPSASPRTGSDAELTMAIRALVESIAEERPVLVVVDDLQWVDPRSERVINNLVSGTHSRRLLLVGASRAAGLGVGDAVTLGPLTADDVRLFLSSLGRVPEETWADSLAESLHDASRGRPFQMIEVLARAHEKVGLAVDDGDWIVKHPELLEATLTEGGALKHRLAELSQMEVRVLAAVSISSRSLEQSEVERVTGDGDVEAVLLKLEGRGFLKHSARGWSCYHDEIGFAALEQVGSRVDDELRRALARVYHRSGVQGDLNRAAVLASEAGDDELLGAILSKHHQSQGYSLAGRNLRQTAEDLIGSRIAGKCWRRARRHIPVWVRISHSRLSRIAGAIAVMVAAVFSTASLQSREGTRIYVVAQTRSPDGQVRSYATTKRYRLGDTLIVRPRRRYRLPELDGAEQLMPSPDGTMIVFIRSIGDNEGREVFVRLPDGEVRNISKSRWDETGVRWSPDSGYLVFNTSRWRDFPGYDIAVADLEGAIRPLVVDSGDKGIPSFSPDGSRIAYSKVSVEDGSTEHCIVDYSGSNERCSLAPPGVGAPLGWIDYGSVLVPGPDQFVYSLDVETWALSIVDTVVNGANHIRGTWYSGRSGGSRDGWKLARYDGRPGKIEFDDEATAFVVASLLPEDRVRTEFVDRVLIDTAMSYLVGVSNDSIVRLLGSGGDTIAHGGRLHVTLSVADTSVLSVSESGGLLPLRAGKAWLTASLGGWRSDSALIEVRDPPDSVMLFEDWDVGMREWVPYGEPLPFAVGSEMGDSSLYVAGDDYFISGTYWPGSFPTRDGLSVSAFVSVPAPGLGYQAVKIGVSTTMFAEGFPDSLTGTVGALAYDDHSGLCWIDYPSGGYRTRTEEVDFVTGMRSRDVVVDRSLGDGRWFWMRLQILPDGRCGVVMDDEVVAVSENHIVMNDSAFVFIEGSTLDTRVLVDSLVVRSGVLNKFRSAFQ